MSCLSTSLIFHARAVCAEGLDSVSPVSSIHGGGGKRCCFVVHTPTVSLILQYLTVYIYYYLLFLFTAAVVRGDRKNGLDFEKSLIYATAIIIMLYAADAHTCRNGIIRTRILALYYIVRRCSILIRDNGDRFSSVITRTIAKKKIATAPTMISCFAQ